MPDKHSVKPAREGCLHVVATPIGNLADLSTRAVQVLQEVDVIMAEDTRHSKRLLNHYGIATRLRSCHEHNEAEQIDYVLAKLARGKDLALISDAGTPLVSDPGFVLTRAVREQGFEVVAIPGPSAITAALSVAGLPTDRFIFDGFLPARSAARRKQLAEYNSQPRTVVLLESSHRIRACLKDIVSVLGGERQVVLARELTKKFETVLSASATEIEQRLLADDDQCRGEFVVLIAGQAQSSAATDELDSMLTVLIEELPVRQAAQIASRLTGCKKNEAYARALEIKD